MLPITHAITGPEINRPVASITTADAPPVELMPTPVHLSAAPAHLPHLSTPVAPPVDPLLNPPSDSSSPSLAVHHTQPILTPLSTRAMDTTSLLTEPVNVQPHAPLAQPVDSVFASSDLPPAQAPMSTNTPSAELMAIQDRDVWQSKGIQLLCMLPALEKKCAQHSASQPHTPTGMVAGTEMHLNDKFIESVRQDEHLIARWCEALANDQATNGAKEHAVHNIRLLADKYEAHGAVILSQPQREYIALLQSEEGMTANKMAKEIDAEWTKLGSGEEEGRALLHSFTAVLTLHPFPFFAHLGTILEERLTSTDHVSICDLSALIHAAKRVYVGTEEPEEVEKWNGLLEEWVKPAKFNRKMDDIASKAQDMLGKLNEKGLGKELLSHGAMLYATHKDDLTAENLLDSTRSLATDADARREFIYKVKDTALSFLLHAIPKMVIPDIHDDNSGFEYDLTNIRVDQFEAMSEDVNVELLEDGIWISGRKIRLQIETDIAYKQQSFPHLKGSGAVKAKAKDVSFEMRLGIEGQLKRTLEQISDNLLSPRAPSSPRSSSPRSAGGFERDTAIRGSTSLSSLPSPSSAQGPVFTNVTPQPHKPDVSTVPSNGLYLVLKDLTFSMPKLKVKFSHTWLSGLLNVMMALFQGTARKAMERAVFEKMMEESEDALKKINAIANKYLPRLHKWSEKAGDVVDEIRESTVPVLEGREDHPIEPPTRIVTDDSDESSVSENQHEHIHTHPVVTPTVQDDFSKLSIDSTHTSDQLWTKDVNLRDEREKEDIERNTPSLVARDHPHV